MDNHPIPQDVTHFQFKLIGELTLKQFGYIAAGGILAWIMFSLPMIFIIKLIIGAIFAGTGLFFAFIPVESRPADLMLSYFFRALFQPNQYIFQKEGITIPMSSKPLPNTASLNQQVQPVQPTNGPMQATTQVMQQTQIQQTELSAQGVSIPAYIPQQLSGQVIQQPAKAPEQTTHIPSETIPQLPTVTIRADSNQMQEKSTQEINNQQTSPLLITTPVKEATQPIQEPIQEKQNKTSVVSSEEPPASNLKNQLQDTLAQKKQLEEQLQKLQQQLNQNTQKSNIDSGTSAIQNNQVKIANPPQQQPVSPIIKTVSSPQNTPKTIIASEFPNIIMGVVRDARGNVLPNILIEVKDADENPVRAFKTNALGQFASATPLLNGTYTVVFEDPEKKHRFDAVQVEATGYIMQPIEIVSLDQREELRKELFG